MNQYLRTAQDNHNVQQESFMASPFRKIVPSRVKTKLLTTLGILLTLMVAVPTFMSYRSTLTSTDVQLREDLKSTITQVYNRITSEKAEQLKLLAHTVAGMPAVQDSVQYNDRDTLLTIGKPLFKGLKKITDLNVFHFHKPPATSLVRLHKTEKYGDDLSGFRHTVVQVNQSQQDAVGIEAGVAGISVRAVVPVMYLNQRHAGSVEFGAPLNDELLLDIKRSIGSNVSLLVPDGGGFRYQAKTHNLTVPQQKFPFLEKVMNSEGVTIQRVNKNNKQLLTAYMPITDYSGNGVGVLAIPKDIGTKLGAAKKRALTSVAIGLAVLIVIQLLVFFLFTRLVDKPIKSFTKLLESASRGDLSQDVDMSNILSLNCSDKMQCNKPECSMYGKEGYCWEEAGSAADQIECPKILNGEYTSCSECKGVFQTAVQDEFSELSAYLHSFIANVRMLVKDMGESSRQLHDSSESLAEISEKIDSGSTESSNLTANVAAASEEMSTNMSSVAAATEEAAANVNVMTSATEEISSTVGEIQQSTVNAQKITGEAVNQASDISVKVDELGESATDIGKVTETIAEISDQTNLLALNATIEAARAGEAGKGFAVVANEIKDLAKQTAEATGEIKQRIDGIQSSTNITVDGIKKISEIISEIDAIVSNIANSLDEQSATMSELTTNITQAGEGIGEVSENVAQSSSVSRQIAEDIAEVSRAVNVISDDTGNVTKNADELKQYSQALRELIAKFKL
jgi:methyl-accepting chemotaxis protein